MNKVSVAAVLLVLCSISVLSGEYLMNDTGETIYGLRVVFSEPVRITAFGDDLATVEPSGASTEFVFSGGEIEAWGGHWFNWEPLSAQIETYKWLHLESSGLQSKVTLSGPGDNLAGSDAVTEIVYGYLTNDRPCSGFGAFQIPVYVSVPFETPVTDVFTVELSDKVTEPLFRVDEVTLVGSVSLDSIPADVSVRIFRNAVQITDSLPLQIENAYQAITLAIEALDEVESIPPFPATFVKGAALTDVWGTFFYGSSLEGLGGAHHRDFFESVCERLAEDGLTDVYVTSTFVFTRVDPLPALDIGEHTMGIEEEDLLLLVERAHKNGLRFHLMYNAGVAADGLFQALTQERKPQDWLVHFFAEYEAMMLDQARMANRCGVDAFMLNWQAAGIDYGAQRNLWYDLWEHLIASVRAVFPGHLEFNICSWQMVADLEESNVSPEVFAGVDSFVLSQWVPHLETYNDSITVLHEYFSAWLESLELLHELLDRPTVLELNLQSTEGYMVDGWSDVAIGLTGNTSPDFFEQSRACEALFQAIARSDVANGVILYKYHWDDPFGPELGLDAISRMDLSGSIRNKPAEAVVKRWMSGIAGPSQLVSGSARQSAYRPWCPSVYQPWPVYETLDAHLPSYTAGEVLGELTWSTLPLLVSWENAEGLVYGLDDLHSSVTTDLPDTRFNDKGLSAARLRGANLETGLAFYLEFEKDDIPSADNHVAYVLEFDPGGQEVTVVPIQNHLSVAARLDGEQKSLQLPSKHLDVASTGIGIVLPYSVIGQFIPPLEPHSHCEVRLRVSYRGHESHGYVRFPGSTILGEAPEDRYSIISAPDAAGFVSVDDFEDVSGVAQTGGEWDYGSTEKYNPGADPDSFCVMSRSTSPESGTCLQADFFYTCWMKIGLNTFIDASEYDGIEVSLWSEVPMRIDVELGVCVEPWTAYTLRGIGISENSTRFRIPFSDFVLEPDRELQSVPEEHLTRICGIGFFANCPGVENTLFVDDLFLYKVAEQP